MTPNLFHFNVDSKKASGILNGKNNVYANKKTWMEDQDFQGLLAVLLSLKKKPDIRYSCSSEAAKKLSGDLLAEMSGEQELFTFHQEPTLLLILDRKDDVVTPLLTQWTYQSMVHELLGISHNRVNLDPSKKKKSKDSLGGKDAQKPKPLKTQEEKNAEALHDIVLSSEQDDFFKQTMFVNFGELGIRVKKLVADFQALTKTKTKLDTLGERHTYTHTHTTGVLCRKDPKHY